ncbi:MAG: type 3 dihydrofolate reductase [Gammaproteobacteria bacterium]|nr:type 3 dihydrofolate reductase [Gammaproteobacteria bacterium]
MISLVVAMAENRVIGKDNQLPWRLPADLKRFRAVTLGKPVLMGRKTYESIGKPLPGRTNIVVTHEAEFRAPGCVVVHTPEAALAAAGDSPEAMVIGGASFYRQMLPRADRLYLTVIHARFEGDAFFPEFDPAGWREVERVRHEPDEKNPYPHSFITLERERGG